MKFYLFIIIIALFSTSCIKDRLTADGNIITEVRNPGTFKEIHSSGSNKIHITYGEDFKVEVRGSGNLVSRYKTRVHNNTLDLGYEHVNVRRDDIEVFVTMPAISGVSLSGSGDADINGNFPDTDRFRVRISGSAKTWVNDPFNAAEVVVNISGSGDAELENLISKQANVTVSGSGDVRLTSTEMLNVRISGSGKVYYTGSPVVDADISGSGRVIKF